MKSVLAAVFTLLNFLLLASAAATPSHGPPCAQCDPNPFNNKCDITTSCIVTQPRGQYHCACRAGYKAAAANTDSSTHWRTLFAGQEYRVFVAPGVACDTLCEHYELGPKSCQEVTVRPECS